MEQCKSQKNYENLLLFFVADLRVMHLLYTITPVLCYVWRELIGRKRNTGMTGIAYDVLDVVTPVLDKSTCSPTMEE